MTREQLAHVLRAASRIAGRREVIVIGSQAILGSFDDTDLPGEAFGSVEANLCFFEDTDDTLADQVDGAIGEASTFHATFGYYAQGVSVSTAILPRLGAATRHVHLACNGACRRALPGPARSGGGEARRETPQGLRVRSRLAPGGERGSADGQRPRGDPAHRSRFERSTHLAWINAQTAN